MHGKPDQFDTTWAAGLDSGLDSPWSKAGEGSQLAVADMRAVERDQRSSAHSDDLPPSGRPRPHKLRRLASISAAIGCGVTAVVVVTAVLALQGDNREAVSPNQETPNSERRISTDVELGQFTASFGDRRGELLVWARGSGVVAIDLRSGVANPFVWGDENTKPEIFVSSKQMLLIVARDGSAAMVNSSGELWELGELAKPEPTDQTAIVDPSNDSILWTQLSRLGDESSFPIRIFPDGSRELVPLAVPAGATPIAVAPGRGLVIASDAGGTFLLGDTVLNGSVRVNPSPLDGRRSSWRNVQTILSVFTRVSILRR